MVQPDVLWCRLRGVKLVPSRLVDALPIDWWHPGNLRRVLGRDLHFCDDDHVRTIEWGERVIGQGRRLFPYGRWDAESN